MITKEQVVQEALTWVGTPFRDQQCVKHVGVDCAMLAFGVARELGLVTEQERRKIAKYSPEQHYHTHNSALVSTMEAFGCYQVSFEEMTLGDFAVFHYGKTEAHIGIIVGKNDDTFVLEHAVKGNVKRVVVVNLTGSLLQQFRKAYRFPGVE